MDQEGSKSKLSKALTKALTRILVPLAKLCIKNEVSYMDFMELSRLSYVESARTDFRLPESQMTNARISMLTGMSRKAVKNTVERLDGTDTFSASPLNKAQRVVYGWLNDPDFNDQNKKPKVLTLKGPDQESGSFIQLIRKYSGDDKFGAILEQLNHSMLTDQPEPNQVRLLVEGYYPHKDLLKQTEIIGKSVSDLFNTTLHNIDCEVDSRRFQREVIYSRIDPELAAQCRVLIEEKAQQLLVELDAKLKDAKEQTKVMNQTLDRKNESLIRQGFGLYYIEDLTEFKELDED